MRKEIKQIQTLKPIMEDKEVFITKDNKQFLNEKEAWEHEKYIITKEEFEKKYNLSQIYIDDSYDVVVIKELNDEVKHQFQKSYGKHLSIKELTVGVNLIHVDDTGDYTYIDIINIDDKIRYITEELEQLKQLKKEKMGL